MQVTALLICGLVMVADLSELMALIISSKSAQFEFCIESTQKSWIGKKKYFFESSRRNESLINMAHNKKNAFF